jgi:SAM-dependent methyltransferase
LVLNEHPGFVFGRAIHFAPEPTVARLLKPLAGEYQSADLFNSADLRLNLEKLELPDASVDTFMVSHVLEHVDDRKALRELNRCLRSGGRAILMVPIVEAWKETYENPAVTDPTGRNLHFGQWDHVRFYGTDFRDRIRDADFDLTEFNASPEECARYGLVRGSAVFVAQKR